MSDKVDDEIQRISKTLADLQARAAPSEALTHLINYYREQLFQLKRRSARYFEPYRNDRGELVVNSAGDIQGDE